MATVKSLIVAGGGQGGSTWTNAVGGGGAGAGGLIYNATTTVTNGTYAVVVGAGGAISKTAFGGVGGNGGNSSFAGQTALGGGGAGGQESRGGSNGGSGGGMAGKNGALGGTKGLGTSGQGYDGGSAATYGNGGGGGGATAVGGDNSSGSGGAGGAGLANPITGSTVGQLSGGIYYLAGGGGGAYSGAGGLGGGGAGVPSYPGGGTAGTDNTGGGGGGGAGDGGGVTCVGGSGVVVISYTTGAINATGGTITTSGGNTIHTFLTSADFIISPPTVTTQAVSSVAAVTATANGNITVTGGANADERGVVYSTATHGDPGNVAPGSSSYSGLVNETGGSFGIGAFTESLTGLTSRTTYYVRAYAHNVNGYGYGSEVSFLTIGFTNPGNVYISDNTYATLAAVNGVLTVEVSKDGGANYGTALTQTFTGSDSLLTYGAGATELWGASYTRADMVDANLRVRLSQGSISQVYKTFGFATGTETLTGIEIAVEANYAASVLSIDLLEVKIHYGTSVLPVQAGSQTYASNGRKVGEGVGAGTGTSVYYDGTAWRRTGDDTTVAA